MSAPLPNSLIFLISLIFLLGGLALSHLIPSDLLLSIHWFYHVPIWLAVIASLVLVGRHWSDSRVGSLTLWLVVLILGVGWGLQGRIRTAPVDLVYDRSVEFVGTVANFPETYDARQEFIVSLTDTGRPVRILVSTSRYPAVVRGAQVRISGKLRQPQNTAEFPEADWLAGKGIYARLSYPDSLSIEAQPSRAWQFITNVRAEIVSEVNQYLPEPAASLALGLVLGITPRIDHEFSDNLARTNLTHLAAVSGQNITLTIFLIFGLMRRFWFRAAVLSTFGLLVFYTIITGAQPSVVRASIMSAFVLVGLLLGRPADGLRGLVLAAALITLANPLAIAHDVGFGLSFFALTGIILLSPAISRKLFFLPESPRIVVATTASASLAVLPLQIAAFGDMSLVGIPANLIVGPLVPLAMGGSFVVAILAAISSSLGQAMAFLLYPLLEVMHVITNWLGHFSWAAITLTLPEGYTIGFVALTLAVFAYFGWRRLRYPWLAVRQGSSR